MMTLRAAIAPSLPLFAWRELAELEAERAELRRRLSLLPRHSHRYVELAARLKDITTRELRLARDGVQP